MLLFREKIGATWATEPADAEYPYLADTSNPDANTWYDVTSIEAWDLYGHFTALTIAQVRDELKALYLGWGSHTTPEKEVFARWFIADKVDRDTIYSDAEQLVFAEKYNTELLQSIELNNNENTFNSLVAGDAAEADTITEAGVDLNSKTISLDFCFNGLPGHTSSSYAYVTRQLNIPSMASLGNFTKIEVKIGFRYLTEGAATGVFVLQNYTDTAEITATEFNLPNGSWVYAESGWVDITAIESKSVRAGWKRVGGTGSNNVVGESCSLILKYS